MTPKHARRSLFEREPARVIALVSGAFVSVGSCLVSIAAGANALGAIGAALIAFGGVIAGGEVIRSQVTPAGGR